MMFPKKVVHLLLAYICLVTGRMEKNSLTFVIDSTNSMKDDINQIKDSVNHIFDSVKNSEDSPIGDFILVTFNDKPSDVVFLTKTTDRKIFKHKLSTIIADGGGDCPESSLSGIKRGLEESRNGSFLYVFTDDVAGENDKVYSEVQNLAIRKKTQVVFIITRSKYCGEIETKSNYQYYIDLAEATNGNTFIMEKNGVKEILKDVSERIKTRQAPFLSLELSAGFHNVTIPVDAGMNDTMLTCTGTNAGIHNITAPDGSTANSTTIVDLPSVITVKIPNPTVGNYTANVGSETESKIVAAATTTIHFEYGFSPLEPTSMGDTVTMPVKDVKSHISVKIFSKETFIPSKIILINKGNEQVENLSLKLHDATENIYITEKVLPPDELFKIVVFGYHEKSKSHIRRESPTFIEVQKTETPKDMSPTMEIDKGNSIKVKYNDSLKLVCKVEASPKPDITWKDEDDNILATEVLAYNLPYSYMAELVIEKATMNKTYKCTATNKIGDINRIINVVVERTHYLDILEKPEDTTIVYKNSDKIYCKVDALPSASITWLKNGAVVRSDEFVEISDAGDILIIKKMMPHLVGDYSCAATNGLESNDLGFKLSIKGTEPRTSIAGPSKVNAEYNKPLFLRCQIEGYPKPKILWIDEKTGEELKSAPVSVPMPYDYGQEMQLEKVTKNATYKCVAENDNGKHSSAVTVVQKVHFNVIEAPKDTNIVYKNSDKIYCKVDALPPASITWHKNGAVVRSNEFLEISDAGDILIIKKMMPHLVGDYSCAATNGLESKDLGIKVSITGTEPRTSIAGPSKVNAEYNKPLFLRCQVEGYPKPKILWIDEKTGEELKSTPVSVPIPYDYGQEMQLEKVTKNATYKCVAENDNGKHSSTVTVAQKFHFNIIEAPKDTNVVYKNSDKIYCKVDALPPASITWHKNGAIVRSNEFVEISDAGDILTIKKMMPHLVGDYSCAATNGLESNDLGFKVSIAGREPRTSIAGPSKVNAEYNKPLFLRCQVEGYPKPKILWIDEKTGEELKSAPVSVPIPYDYGQEMQLEKVTKNGTYKCVAENDNGKHSSAVSVVQKVHFNVIEAPKDTNVVYRNSDKIYCKVDALPRASITWHKNGAVVRSNEFVEISDAGDILTIKKMMPHLVGDYSCAATNGLESHDLGFKVSIAGGEPRTSIAGPLKVNAEYNKPLFLRCQVEGYPKPKILWIDEKTGEELNSAPVSVPIPYDYGQEMQLEKVTKNVTYKCVAENDNGKHSSAVTVVTIQKVHFNIIEAPKDTAIKYKEEGQIFCKIDAYPSASIQWNFKGKAIKNSDHYEISSDGSTLRVSDMQPYLIGYYSCVIGYKNKRRYRKKNFRLLISGTVKPEIDKSDNDIITIKEGSPVDFDCRIIKGTPPPTISWEFQPDDEVKFGKVEDSSSSIHFEKVTRYDSGAYRCIAGNVMGNDYHVVRVIIEFPPTIEKAKKQVDSKEGDKTTLQCMVHGYPPPTVVWRLNGANITDSREYKIFRDNSLRFSASLSNDGIFTCTATNKHGTAKIETQVDYYAEIRFEPPDATIINTYVGEKEKLECEAYSYPTPTITWLFQSSEAKLTEKVVPTTKSRPNELVLRILNTNQDGYYTCLASNKKSEKRLTFTVDVKEPAHIIRDTASTRPIRAVKGDLVRIPCRAVGKPKPSVTWFHNGYNIPTGYDSYSMDTDGALLIDNITEGGDFFCDANNKLSASARELFTVDLEEYPTPTKIYATYSLEFGKPAVVECPIPHKLTDLLRWYRNTELKVIGELKFDKVFYSDAGGYTCRVTDRISFKSESRSVKIAIK